MKHLEYVLRTTSLWNLSVIYDPFYLQFSYKCFFWGISCCRIYGLNIIPALATHWAGPFFNKIFYWLKMCFLRIFQSTYTKVLPWKFRICCISECVLVYLIHDPHDFAAFFFLLCCHLVLNLAIEKSCSFLTLVFLFLLLQQFFTSIYLSSIIYLSTISMFISICVYLCMGMSVCVCVSH